MDKLAVVAWLSDIAPEQTECAAWGWASTLDAEKRVVVEGALASDGLDGVVDLFLVGEAHGGLGEVAAGTLVEAVAA